MEDLGPFVLPYTRTHHFTAAANGRDYRVFVATPSAKTPDRPLPILFALDANGGMGTVVETARMMMLGNEIEQIIIAGIGYNASLREMMGLRNYELSPSHDPAFVERAATQGQAIEKGGLGGAPGFLQFIAHELAPFMEAEYGASPDDRGIWGFSSVVSSPPTPSSSRTRCSSATSSAALLSGGTTARCSAWKQSARSRAAALTRASSCQRVNSSSSPASPRWRRSAWSATPWRWRRASVRAGTRVSP